MTVLAAAALIAGATAGELPCTAADFVDCTEIVVPVRLGGGVGPIAGTLCVPPGATRIQVLLAGSTYNRTYWAHPVDSYSYTRHENRRGEATLALDRLGTGASWHPPSADLSFTAQYDAVRQVVDTIRAGQLDDIDADSTIVLVGHSYGGYVALGAAGTGASVDAVITTGATHSPLDYAALAASPALMRPAALDPMFAGQAAADDLGYLTTWPGVRATFYADAEPEIIAMDEQHKDLIGAAEISPATAATIDDASRAIELPVLALVGGADFTSCPGTDCTTGTALAAAERAHFGSGAQVHAAVVPGAGHNLTLERSRREAWREIDEFLAVVPHHGHR